MADTGETYRNRAIGSSGEVKPKRLSAIGVRVSARKLSCELHSNPEADSRVRVPKASLLHPITRSFQWPCRSLPFSVIAFSSFYYHPERSEGSAVPADVKNNSRFLAPQSSASE